MVRVKVSSPVVRRSVFKAVFFKLFSEVEPFTTILIAHWTHVFWGGDSWGPKGQNSRPKAESGFLGRGNERGSGQSPDCTYILDQEPRKRV